MSTQSTSGVTAAEIAQYFRVQIQAGNLKAGDRLPSVREIATNWSAARGTANKAIASLQRAGLVTTSERSGTVVASADTRYVESTVALVIEHRPHMEIVTSDISRISEAAANEIGVPAGSSLVILKLRVEQFE